MKPEPPEKRIGEAFRGALRQRARGAASLGHLDPAVCESAMEMILSGEATPAQAAGFLLVGRAAGGSPAELAAYVRAVRRFARAIDAPPSTVTVAGGFDGKLRTLNIGAAASIAAASVGAKTLLIGCEDTPPKEGRTPFDALANLGVPASEGLEGAGRRLRGVGLAAVATEHYLPEMHALLGLRWEMARRTVLNVIEKLVSPVPGSPLMVGVTHASSLEAVPEALVALDAPLALVYQAIEGSDEAPLDGSSALALVKDGRIERFRVEPESVGLGGATKSDVPWRGEEDESRRLRGAMAGEDSAVRDLILYNAALRVWVAEGATGATGSLAGCVEKVAASLDGSLVGGRSRALG